MEENAVLRARLAKAEAEIGRLHDAVLMGVSTVVLSASSNSPERLAQMCVEDAGATWPHDTPGGELGGGLT